MRDKPKKGDFKAAWKRDIGAGKIVVKNGRVVKNVEGPLGRVNDVKRQMGAA